MPEKRVFRKVKCPYCGVSTAVPVQLDELHQVRVFVCDTEDGGCGEMFAVQSKVSVEISVFSMEKADD